MKFLDILDAIKTRISGIVNTEVGTQTLTTLPSAAVIPVEVREEPITTMASRKTYEVVIRVVVEGSNWREMFSEADRLCEEIMNALREDRNLGGLIDNLEITYVRFVEHRRRVAGVVGVEVEVVE